MEQAQETWTQMNHQLSCPRCGSSEHLARRMYSEESDSIVEAPVVVRKDGKWNYVAKIVGFPKGDLYWFCAQCEIPFDAPLAEKGDEEECKDCSGKVAFEKAVTVNIPVDAWQPNGPEDDPTSRLLSSLVIYGTYHHLEAYAVTEDENGIQVAAHPIFQSNLDGMYEVGEPDKAFECVTIGLRQYVLAMTPYC